MLSVAASPRPPAQNPDLALAATPCFLRVDLVSFRLPNGMLPLSPESKPEKNTLGRLGCRSGNIWAAVTWDLVLTGDCR